MDIQTKHLLSRTSIIHSFIHQKRSSCCGCGHEHGHDQRPFQPDGHHQHQKEGGNDGTHIQQGKVKVNENYWVRIVLGNWKLEEII